MPEDAISILSDIRMVMEEIRDLLAAKKAKPKELAARKRDETLPELAQIWNEFAHPSFLKVTAMTSSAKRHIMATTRWLEKPDREYWKKVILILNESEFCRGSNNRKWVANFDFLVRPDTRYKAIEGLYTKGNSAKRRGVVGYLQDGTPLEGNL